MTEDRPAQARSEDHLCAHTCLFMPTFHVECQKRRHLALILFEDDDREVTGAAALAGGSRQRIGVPQGKSEHLAPPGRLSVRGFTTLLVDLASLTLYDVT